MAGGQEGTSVWGGGGRGGKQRLRLPSGARNNKGTCLPAVSAPTSISAAAGIQAKGNNNPASGCPEKKCHLRVCNVVKILALKLPRRLGKVYAWDIYRKCKHGKQFASWKLSSEVFSRPVKPHPWPLPMCSMTPRRVTGNAVSNFGIFKILEP